MQSLEVVEGQFLKTNGKEHCFLAPAKLPRSAILNNFVNKIITAIQKSLKLLLYSRGTHQKMAPHCQNLFITQAVPTIYLHVIIFQTEVKVTVFC